MGGLFYLAHDALDQQGVGWRKDGFASWVLQSYEQRSEPVVEVGATLKNANHVLVRAERTADERCRRRLINLDQAEIAQRALRRERLPAGIVKDAERQCERGIRASVIAMSTAAKRRD